MSAIRGGRTRVGRTAAQPKGGGATAKAHSAPKQPLAQVIPALSLQQKAARFDQLMEKLSQERAEGAERRKTERKVERDRHRLTRADMKRAIDAITDIHFAAVSTHRLSRYAVDAPEDSEWFLVAIENSAKVIAMKSDLVASILGPKYSVIGNFADEFRAPGGES